MDTQSNEKPKIKTRPKPTEKKIIKINQSPTVNESPTQKFTTDNKNETKINVYTNRFVTKKSINVN